MSTNLDRIKTSPKTGDEPFYSDKTPADKTPPEYKLKDFWEWSVSDLVSNAMRGRLAEFL